MASPPAKRARVASRVASSRPLRTWCNACISRLARDHTHRCHDQEGAGGRCSACARGNRKCKTLPFAAIEPLQEALRLCEGGKTEEAAEAIKTIQRLLRRPSNPAPQVPREGDEYLALIQRAVSAFERIANAMEIIAEGRDEDEDED
ncbi:hypothetical protein DHEL01_v200565 [Diaporthe helianthi]|uniref:Uncharacterized protein n=1 Tax=Diaporthe helianthi TaxID=158607 RepID=A0A2P5IEZ0_DIAHE|nr:hypothetical protein DHEL01_v200565 [Diaporthe helianthi]